MATSSASAQALAQIELRSIDHVPLEERHGRIRDQFTLWFGNNANIFNVVLGGVLVFMGLNLVWAAVAIVVGTPSGWSSSASTRSRGRGSAFRR